MANVNRIMNGKEWVTIDVDDTTVVEIGDFICVVVAADSADDATLTDEYGCPPPYLVDAGDEAANREAAADQLIGISTEASANGDDDPILVCIAGQVKLEQKSAAAIHIRDPIEIYASAVNCEAQTVVEGSTSPVATCVKTKSSTGTTVFARLIPSLWNTFNA